MQNRDNNICKFSLCISVTNIFFLLCYQTLQIFFYVQGSFLVLKGQKKTTNMKWLKNILASITDDISMNIGSVIGPKVHP